MEKTYCIFGDSVVQAAYVNNGWVKLLTEYLEDKYPNDFVNVFNLGIGGNTTDEVLARLENEARVRNPNFILIAVGINDSKDDHPEQFRINLEKITKKAFESTRNMTFVGLVLGNWQGIEAYDQNKTTKFNEIINEVAKEKECRFISLQNVLTNEDFLDGLHPNEQGHRKMFEVIREYF